MKTFSKAIEYIKQKNVLKKILRNLEICIASLAIVLSPFIIDYSNLPKGYEIPKVVFLVIISALITIISIVRWYFSPKSIQGKKSYFILLIILILFLVTTALSPYEIALVGNSFRFQGLITYFLIFVGLFSIYKSLTSRSIYLLIYSFVISSTLQALIGISQFWWLYENDYKKITEGLWVNGSFGQANWFSGHLFVGIILTVYLFNHYKLRSKEFVYKIISGIALVMQLVAICYSLSIWAMIILPIFLIIIIATELISPKNIKKAFVPFFILFVVVLTVGISLYKQNGFDFRIHIWNNTLFAFQQADILHKLFGFGFDTQGELFKQYRLIEGSLVDRAHNFFLDILIQNGIITLVLFFALFVDIARKARKILSNKLILYFFILFFAWIVRSFVHESGIINLFEFGVISVILLNLLNVKPTSSQQSEFPEG